jgi:uroporphyrinogen decarboxylase
MIQPNFERFRTVLLRRGEPDYVPLGDIGVHPMLKAGVLGRPIRTMEDEVAFWVAAGYDYVPVEQGLQQSDVIRRQSMHELEAHYAVESDEAVVRSWATEGKGLISTMAEFEAFRWPDPDALDYGAFERIGPLLPPAVKVIAVLGKIFSCVWWLMGLEGMSLALADEPELVPRVFRKVGEIQLRVFERMLRYDCVGTFWHADDIAFATQLLISPRILREHLFPWYAEMNRMAHARGRLTVYHSDGALQEVLDDIVACGFDGLNPIEPKAMDIHEVKAAYGSRLAILGNIDLGYTLTRGTPDEVREEVRQRIRALAPGGGYAVASSNSIPEYVPLANFNALRQATFDFGRYPIRA